MTKEMRKNLVMGAVAALALSGAALADGTHYDFDVAGIQSFGTSTAPGYVTTIDLAAAMGFASGTSLTVTGIGWDVVLTAFDPSWLSEMRVNFQGAVNLNPGAGVTVPGEQAFSSGGIIKLLDVGIPDIILPTGMLTLSFYETFEDGSVDPDGEWKDGYLTIQVAEKVPAPGAIALIGMAGLISRRRRA